VSGRGSTPQDRPIADAISMTCGSRPGKGQVCDAVIVVRDRRAWPHTPVRPAPL